LSKSSVVDANVWLALLASHHQHHHASKRWFESLSIGEAGLCRAVQIALIRLLGNRMIMGPNTLSAAEAWRCIQLSRQDERVEFLHEPPDLDMVLPTLFRYSAATPQLINDAYLAAFAISSDRSLVTRDRGFLQFQGLDVELLGD
jgi:toxin-antitoxin system PIN domain toxin